MAACNKLHKYHRVFMDFDKEEKWVNEMAAKGLNFVGYTFLTYLFMEGTPGEYQYRFYLLEELPTSYESMKYIEFMKEAGIECVGTYMRWAFFRKRTQDGRFEIDTDFASKIRYYKRVLYMVSTIALANMTIGLSNTISLLFNNRPMRYISSLGLVNILLFFLFLPFIIRTYRKIKRMKTESSLFE